MNDENNKPPATSSRLGEIDAGSQALAEALRSSFVIVKVAMGLLVALFLFSGFFTVGSEEEAIILRFGKPLGEGDRVLLSAGAHWAFPYPVDEVVKVRIRKIQEVKSTVGWFAQTPEQEALNQDPPSGPSLNPAFDGYVLTADGNIIHSKVTLNYHIEDPVRFVFGFVNASNAVQNALNNALLATAARFRVDDILTRDRIGFQDAVRRRVLQLIEQQGLGISVDQCAVNSRPPRQLKQAFDNVVTAGQNRDKILNEARSYKNQVLSKVSADAAGRLDVAEAERTRLVESVTSEADTFERLLPKYKSNPDLFVQQRLVETMSRVLTNVQDKIFLAQRADGKARELRVLLNREPPKPKTEEAK